MGKETTSELLQAPKFLIKIENHWCTFCLKTKEINRTKQGQAGQALDFLKLPNGPKTLSPPKPAFSQVWGLSPG
jgi:hypothetical protein